MVTSRRSKAALRNCEKDNLAKLIENTKCFPTGEIALFRLSPNLNNDLEARDTLDSSLVFQYLDVKIFV